MSTYRRLVLDLYHGASDAQTIRAAAEFARLLHLDLHCLFIEDEAVHALAALPFAREIRLPTHVWSPMDADTLAAELREAAARTRRALDDVIGGLGLTREFKVLRGDPAECVAGFCGSGDILVVSEPAPPARAAHGVARRRRTMHDATVAVLLLPIGVAAGGGPIAVVLENPSDPALEVACAIAIAADESLTIAMAGAAEATQASERAHALGVPRVRIAVRRMHGTQPDDVLHALGTLRERLIVMSRGASNADAQAASHIAAQRAVPVLLIEKADTKAAA